MDQAHMAQIRIVGRDDAIDAPEGTSLYSALQRANVPISTSCGGQSTCGFCRLTVLRGKELLSPVSAKDVCHIGNVAKVVDIRLACQAMVTGDGEIEIDIPPVADIAARKREQTRRGFAERASRRRSGSGPASDSQPASGGRDPKTPGERIEWRPSKLNAPTTDQKPRAAGGDSADGHQGTRRR